MKHRRWIPIAMLLILAVLAGAWYIWGRGNGESDSLLTASGTVEAVEVIVSPEMTGRVTDVLAVRGEAVTAGMPLLQLDDTLLQAQRRQAEAAEESASAAVAQSESALVLAELQYRQVLESALLADSAYRVHPWIQSQPWQFDRPAWYFGKAEQIAALEAEVDAAQDALASVDADLQTLLGSDAYAGIPAAEQRLALARAAFRTAQDALDRADGAAEGEDFRDSAQERFDAAEEELGDAQDAYDDLLDSDTSADLAAARGKVRAAEERRTAALEALARLHTGEQSLAVGAADALFRQAQDALIQARAGLSQAQAQRDLLDAQIAKLTVYAPSDGTVLERNIEPGEVALAGSSALVLGRLDRLTITVYLPEDRYGEIDLGQHADIAADSFPGKAFTGTVTRIASRAEFTPRNVQTEEGRRTTVFAVEIAIDDPGGELKPGMPADVTFRP